MTDDDPGDSTDRTTVLIHRYPMLDFFVVSSLSGVFVIGVVVLTVHGWQLLVRDGAVLLPAIVGAVAALGSLLTVPFLVDLDSG